MADARAAALCATLLVLGACASEDGARGSGDDAERRALSELRYDDAALPLDPSNRVVSDLGAQRFGQRLFFETALSGPLIEGDHDGSAGTLGERGDAGRVSCASCHVPEDGFVDTRSPHRQISLGSQWTQRRAQTLLDVSFAPLFNWDGRRDSIWHQAIGVMENAKELNSSRLFVAQQIHRLHRAEYEAVFGALPPLDDAARFPVLPPEKAGCVQILTMQGARYECYGKPGDPEYDALTPDDQRAVTEVMVNVGKALAAYVALLRCGPSRFDAWLDGDQEALNASEQRGARLFVGRAGCVSCHSGPRLSDGDFHNVGLAPAPVAVAFVDADDRGAALGLAELASDPLNSHGELSDGARAPLRDATAPELEGAFRTPTLRCIANQPSFMHTGQIRTLSQAVTFHDRGGDAAGHYPGQSELTPLGLSEADRADLVSFLAALQGEGPSPELREAP